jgi:hypothetical protein
MHKERDLRLQRTLQAKGNSELRSPAACIGLNSGDAAVMVRGDHFSQSARIDS